MTDTWTWRCEWCGVVHATAEEYMDCQCVGMKASRAGNVRAAELEARERGMAFLVDGKHVSSDRVMIFSVPDTVGPIGAMRRAKDEAAVTLRAVQDVTDQKHGLLGEYIVLVMQALGMPHPKPNEFYGSHSFVTLCDIAEQVRVLNAQLDDARADETRIDWLDKRRELSPDGHHRWLFRVDAGMGNVRLAMDSLGALTVTDTDGVTNQGSQCKWCGLWGKGYSEAEQPVDVCHHECAP